ncbi:MAG: 50S ribosomal protein L24 [bacterium]
MVVKKSDKEKTKPTPTTLRKGDLVMVIAGGNKTKRPIKGKVAKIKEIVGAKNDRVILDGLNIFTRNKKATKPGEEGGKVQVEKSVHISNVMYYVEQLKKPVRLVRSTSADGKRVRGYKDPSSKIFVALEA